MSAAAPARYDAVVVGGGPAGATAADVLARGGARVLLLDRAGRIKPCGGAVPPRLIRDFAIPEHLLVARVRSARIVAPSGRTVDMPIEDGYVGMVDRGPFDEWLRDRAAAAGAERREGTFRGIVADGPEGVTLEYDSRDGAGGRQRHRLRARTVIGADGAASAVRGDALPDAERVPCVAAYHEIVESPPADAGFDGARCDVIYRGSVSPDFYADVRAALQQLPGNPVQLLVAVGEPGEVALPQDGGGEPWLGEDHHPRRRLQQMGAGARAHHEKEGVLDAPVQPDDAGQPAEDLALAALAQHLGGAAARGVQALRGLDVREAAHSATPASAGPADAGARRAARSLSTNCAAFTP